MDAYNRGYDASIILPVEIGSTQIGTAKIVASIADDNVSAKDIGFYALAYDTNGDGKADVISYRGTDSPRNDTLVGKDKYHGWTLGAGNLASEQGKMAVEFYKSVTGAGNLFTSDITLTGHSLGGGLAERAMY